MSPFWSQQKVLVVVVVDDDVVVVIVVVDDDSVVVVVALLCRPFHTHPNCAAQVDWVEYDEQASEVP